MKKFKLTSEFIINALGVKLFRIEALVDFNGVRKGDKGGFVEKESNLSGNAWVYGNAEVYGNALVSGDAWVYGNALVSGNAEVSGNAWVYGNAEVYGKVFTLNFGYNLTLTDTHIKYGCIQKTIKEWIDFLESDEIIETERDTDKFKILEMSLRLAIEQHKQLNK